MKNINKLFSVLLVFVLGMFLASTINLEAASEDVEPLIESVDGASIRTKTENSEQGLRFYAKVTDNYENEAKGFYLMFGEATIADLESAIGNDMVDSKGKNVVDVPVGGVTDDGEFSVVLTGIPDTGYLDKITVIPYVLVEGTNVFVNPVTRSVGEVAIKMASAGETPPEGIIKLLSVVSFDLGYGGLMLDDVIVFKDSVVNKPADPIREGYKFLGWYLNENLYNFTELVPNNIKLVAKWKEQVTVEVKSMVSSYTEMSDNTPASDFNLDSNIFNVSKVGGVNLYHDNRNFGPHGGGMLTISIKPEYVITAVSIIQGAGGPTKVSFSDGTTQDLEINTPYTNDDLNTTYINIKNISGKLSRVDELFITYEVLVQHNVSFDTNGGNIIENIAVAEGTTLTLPEPPTKANNDFDGWYTDIALETQFVESTPITSDLILYAKWVQTFEVSFELNGGSNIDPINVRKNEQLTLPTNPTRRGYEFIGWFNDVELTNEFVSTTPITNNIILFAKWLELPKYIVTFETNGGSMISAVEVIQGNQLTLPEAPIKEGFTFGGWFTDLGLTVVFDSSAPITEAITLYAKWEELPAEQTYVEDFTNSTATTSYTNGSFVGVNGITWSYVESRDDNGDANTSGIVAPAIMLRRASDDSAISSSTISGGISSFSVKLYKGFTGGGDRQVELFINGISQGTSNPFDDFDEHIFEVKDINIGGDIIIEIRNITSKQVIIDDITWTTYTT